MGAIWNCIAILALVSASPVSQHSQKTDSYQDDLSLYTNYTANEVCFYDGRIFQNGDTLPNSGVCEECKCEPPSIVCHMLKCPLNINGCRGIQHPDQCCPEYKCECEYNGRLYNDGETLNLPESSCQVCYCKGGEVLCNAITCYHRYDCQPIQVPDRCCPIYHDCPETDSTTPTLRNGDHVDGLRKKTNYGSVVINKPWLLADYPQIISLINSNLQYSSTKERQNTASVDWIAENKNNNHGPGLNKKTPGDLNFHTSTKPDSFHIPRKMISTRISSENRAPEMSDVSSTPEYVIFRRVYISNKTDNQHNDKSSQTSPPIKVLNEDAFTGLSKSSNSNKFQETEINDNKNKSFISPSRISEDQRKSSDTNTMNISLETTSSILINVTEVTPQYTDNTTMVEILDQIKFTNLNISSGKEHEFSRMLINNKTDNMNESGSKFLKIPSYKTDKKEENQKEAKINPLTNNNLKLNNMENEHYSDNSINEINSFGVSTHMSSFTTENISFANIGIDPLLHEHNLLPVDNTIVNNNEHHNCFNGEGNCLGVNLKKENLSPTETVEEYNENIIAVTDNPPVLELMSDLPFLYFGGYGQQEPSSNELEQGYQRVTITNENGILHENPENEKPTTEFISSDDNNNGLEFVVEETTTDHN